MSSIESIASGVARAREAFVPPVVAARAASVEELSRSLATIDERGFADFRAAWGDFRGPSNVPFNKIVTPGPHEYADWGYKNYHVDFRSPSAFAREEKTAPFAAQYHAVHGVTGLNSVTLELKRGIRQSRAADLRDLAAQMQQANAIAGVALLDSLDAHLGLMRETVERHADLNQVTSRLARVYSGPSPSFSELRTPSQKAATFLRDNIEQAVVDSYDARQAIEDVITASGGRGKLSDAEAGLIKLRASSITITQMREHLSLLTDKLASDLTKQARAIDHYVASSHDAPAALTPADLGFRTGRPRPAVDFVALDPLVNDVAAAAADAHVTDLEPIIDTARARVGHLRDAVPASGASRAFGPNYFEAHGRLLDQIRTLAADVSKVGPEAQPAVAKLATAEAVTMSALFESDNIDRLAQTLHGRVFSDTTLTAVHDALDSVDALPSVRIRDLEHDLAIPLDVTVERAAATAAARITPPSDAALAYSSAFPPVDPTREDKLAFARASAATARRSADMTDVGALGA